MKKTLSRISLTLAIVMLVMACPLAAFAIADASVTDKAPYADYGQTLYTTNGANYKNTSTITVDGTVNADEGWVDITPDGVGVQFTSAYNNVYSDGVGGTDGLTAITSDYAAYAGDMKYYVAKDDTDVYFAFEHLSAFVDSNGNGVLDANIEGTYREDYNVRIGFGTDASLTERSLYFRIDADTGHAVVFNAAVGLNASGADKHNWARDIAGADALVAASAMGIYKYDAEKDAPGDYVGATSSYFNYPGKQGNARWMEYGEIKLNIEAIKSIYATAYGVTLTDEDLDNMNVSVATRVYVNTSGSDLKAVCYPTFSGTYVTPGSVFTHCSLIPDLVRFTEIEEPTTEEPTTEAPDPSTPIDISDYADVYYGGAGVAEEITIDGVIDDAYTLATYKGAKVNIVDGSFEGFTDAWAPTLSSKALNVVEPNAINAAVANNIKVNYYLAQDDESVYVAIDIAMPAAQYTIDDINYNVEQYLITNVRLGFNPDDYTQQVALVSDGYWAGGWQMDKFGLGGLYSGGYPLVVTGLADNENVIVKRGVDTDIIAEHPSDSAMSRLTADGVITRTYEMKLNKAAIEAEYADAFGADVDFDGIYIGVSASDYQWDDDKWDCYSLFFVTGNVLAADDAEANGLNTWIPDIALFVDDPNPPETEEETTTEEEVTTEPEEETTEEEVTSEEEVTTEPEEETTEAPATEAPTTEAPTTEAPTTEPAESEPTTEVAPVETEPATTEAPVTEAPKTEAPTTEAPAEEEKGCGSTVGVAGIALITALGACTVFAAKKKED